MTTDERSPKPRFFVAFKTIASIERKELISMNEIIPINKEEVLEVEERTVMAHIEMDIMSDGKVRFKMEGDMKLEDLMNITRQTNGLF